ncbi:MAG: hypothetical protein DMG72_20330 [Acidobacteria bacterium]|nr:MAG: hypothetical protein DMG72_20330 [Acidobacteriota bacterium]
MTTDFSAQFTAQWMQTVINLFERGMSGFRFQPPLSGETADQELCRWLGAHNADSIVFRDRDER